MFIGVLLTIITGLFFLIGIIILKNSKYKEKLSIFTIALAFVVLLGLIFFELLPEIIETKNIYLLFPIVIGLLILVVLDKFIPHHHHEHDDKHCDKLEHNLHLNHIGIITIIALAIHNLIEGITLYSIAINSVKNGLLMMIGISLHNIPLGFQIGNSLDKKKSSIFLIILLCISSFLGSLIMIAFGGINENVISILLALTFGMLIYILFFELFGEVRKYLNKKETIYGIIIGIIILFITHVL